MSEFILLFYSKTTMGIFGMGILLFYSNNGMGAFAGAHL